MSRTLNIILVNFRTPDLTIACLETLEAEVAAVPGTRVVVVENGSGDDSASRLAAAIRDRGWGEWAALLVFETNAGFSGGNNRGIRAAGPARYTLLLNTDTLVHPGCLRYCVDVMERDPAIGAMGCKLLNRDGTLQKAAWRFPSPLRIAICTTSLPWRCERLFGWASTDYRGWDRETQRKDVDWLGGAFLLVRGEVMQKLGGLDERFFFYGEDVEFCHRVWRAGYRCHYDPAVSTTHLGGASSDPTRMVSAEREAHFLRGQYLVQRRCYGLWAAAFVRACDIVGVGARLAVMRIKGRQNEEKYRHMRLMLQLLMRSPETTA